MFLNIYCVKYIVETNIKINYYKYIYIVMTDTVANNDSVQRNTGFRLNKYSFIVKDFTPVGQYPYEVKNDKVYVNLTSYEERTAFFADLKDKNIRARETLYEYFVPSTHQLDGQQVTFQSIVAYLRTLTADNESTKNLKRCFKVVNDNANFKVIVSSYALASLLNTSRVFFPYRRSRQHRSDQSREARSEQNDVRVSSFVQGPQESGVSYGSSSTRFQSLRSQQVQDSTVAPTSTRRTYADVSGYRRSTPQPNVDQAPRDLNQDVEAVPRSGQVHGHGHGRGRGRGRGGGRGRGPRGPRSQMVVRSDGTVLSSTTQVDAVSTPQVGVGASDSGPVVAE